MKGKLKAKLPLTPFVTFEMTSEEIRDLFKIGIVKQKQSEFLIYDSRILANIYYNEIFSFKDIPYTDLINLTQFIDLKKQGIKYRIKIHNMKNHFNINNDNISIFQENALDRLIKLKKVNDNGRALRLCDFKINNNELTLCVQKAWYYDQACSNLVMDFKTDKLGDSINLREYLIKKYKKGYLPPLKTKLLANTIGIACVLMRKTDNGIIPYLVHRNKSIIKKVKII
jgi:hypothetical protein